MSSLAALSQEYRVCLQEFLNLDQLVYTAIHPLLAAALTFYSKGVLAEIAAISDGLLYLPRKLFNFPTPHMASLT